MTAVRVLRRCWLLLLVGCMAVVAVPTAFARTSMTASTDWRVRSVLARSAGDADQGTATVTIRGVAHLVTRGRADIPAALAAQGWVHVGDPGASGSAVADAYQGSPAATAKLFTFTTADGRRHDFVHRLVPGESYHNSFAAVSLDHRWLVSGEWGASTRLLVYRLPAGYGSPGQHPLPLAGTIRLLDPVRDVQGCAFDGSIHLICSTNDPGTTLFPVPRQLLRVSLAHPLRAGTDAGSVALLGSAPAQTLCAYGTGETEGVDLSRGALRVSVNSPCSGQTQIFTLVRTWAREALDLDSVTRWSQGGTTPPGDVSYFEFRRISQQQFVADGATSGSAPAGPVRPKVGESPPTV